MTPSLSKVTNMDVGYAKRNKRMHTQKRYVTCSQSMLQKKYIEKKIKDAYPKKVCHMPTRHDKKQEEEKKIAHIQEK